MTTVVLLSWLLVAYSTGVRVEGFGFRAPLLGKLAGPFKVLDAVKSRTLDPNL